MAQTHKINTLPGAERNAVIRALRIALTESAEPNYRALTAKLSQDLPAFAKLSISHNAVYRFAKNFVIPSIAKALEKSAAAQTEDTKALAPSNLSPDQILANETERALVDDPIVRAVVAKRRRLERALDATFEAAQYDTYGRLESVDLKALEMHAKAIQHPGFTAAAPQVDARTQVVVVLPSMGAAQAAREAQGDVIDVEAE